MRFEEVASQSAAEKFGFKPNDVILKCGDKEVNTLAEFLKVYSAVPAGSTLSPGSAKINGEGGHPHYDAGKDYMGSWMNKNAWLEWKTQVAKSGDYDVLITLASPAAGNEFEIQVGEQKLSGTVPNTDNWEKFETVKLGTVSLGKAGETTVTLKPTKVSGAVMNIRSIMLESR